MPGLQANFIWKKKIGNVFRSSYKRLEPRPSSPWLCPWLRLLATPLAPPSGPTPYLHPWLRPWSCPLWVERGSVPPGKQTDVDLEPKMNWPIGEQRLAGGGGGTGRGRGRCFPTGKSGKARTNQASSGGAEGRETGKHFSFSVLKKTPGRFHIFIIFIIILIIITIQ